MTKKYTGRGQLVNRLASQVGSKEAAIGILKKRGQMDKNGKLTPKGQARNRMTAGERAIDRARKSSGKPAASYKYNPRTNRATLRKR